MGQDQIVVRLEQYQPLPQALLALAHGVDPASNRRHALAQIEVEALDKRGINGPTPLRQDLFDR
jgi:hypothetical protein